jgi:hypothetical protein
MFMGAAQAVRRNAVDAGAGTSPLFLLALVVGWVLPIGAPARAAELFALSSRNVDSARTLDRLEYVDGELRDASEVVFELPFDQQVTGFAFGDLDGDESFDDFVFIGRDSLVNALHWFELAGAQATYRATLLETFTGDIDLLQTTVADLDGDSFPDILVLDFQLADERRRLMHYEFADEQLAEVGELSVPLPVGTELTSVAVGRWDADTAADVVTTERETSGSVEATLVRRYSYNAGSLAFVEELVRRDGEIHDFRGVALARADGSAGQGLILVEGLFDGAFSLVEQWIPYPAGLGLSEFLMVSAPVDREVLTVGGTVVTPPAEINWDALSARTRSISVNLVDPAIATGGAGTSAIRVTMVDLQNPNPPNNNPPGACCPPGNFVTFDTAMTSVCAGGNNQGYRCTGPADCPGSSCPAGVGCTAVGEGNGCARWVGPPLGYLESNDNPGLGNYRVGRLQCTPYYHDWASEPNNGLVNVLGAEIVPSSTYEVRTYGSDCKGSEGSCGNVSAPVIVTTRRAGDIATPFQGAPPLTQPNAVDVANVVNKFRNLAGSPSKVVSQVQPNFPDPNADINAIDIVTVVDNQRGFGYTYSGPCVCPSTVPCNTTACAGASACIGLYGAGATCIKTCSTGARTGQPCNNNLNCGSCIGGPLTGNGAAGIPCDANSDCASGNCGLGVCPTGATPGFCRDRCGRCN